MRQISFKRSRWLKDYKAILKNTNPSHCARCDAVGSGWVPQGNLHPHHPFGRSRRVFVACIMPLCHDCHINFVHDHPDEAREDGWIVKTRSKQERDKKNESKS